METTTQKPTAQRVPQALVGSGRLVRQFRVHLWVCGNHGGYYEHPTREEAVEDMERRKRDYGILRCHYELEEPRERCRACDAYADLMSGLGMYRDVPDCDHLANRSTQTAGESPATKGKQ